VCGGWRQARRGEDESGSENSDWYSFGMKIAIDAVGRLVVPKALRAELGISGATELEVFARDGVIELAVADVPARLEDRGGDPVIATDRPMKPLTVEAVRAAVDRVRR
jgi:AbrB family looped-hinge helix DNA binding protein